jgi:hypothetical protein
MSTPATPPPPATPGPEAADQVLKVVSHSGLLYWWPVWLVGFILSALTWLEGTRLAVVPAGTRVAQAGDNVFTLVVPKRPTAALEQAAQASAQGQDPFPIRVSGNRSYGMVFVVLTLLVIFGTNVPLRGLWSVVAVLVLFTLVLLLAWMDAWGPILERLWGLHVQISVAGYLVPSVVLFVMWVVTVFGFDQLRYIRFTAGQFVVHKDIGDAREVFDATPVILRKRRSDLFRCWILGMGAGDLVVSIPAQNREIVLPNVLWVAWKIRQIADLMKIRPVVEE